MFCDTPICVVYIIIHGLTTKKKARVIDKTSVFAWPSPHCTLGVRLWSLPESASITLGCAMWFVPEGQKQSPFPCATTLRLHDTAAFQRAISQPLGLSPCQQAAEAPPGGNHWVALPNSTAGDRAMASVVSWPVVSCLLARAQQWQGKISWLPSPRWQPHSSAPRLGHSPWGAAAGCLCSSLWGENMSNPAGPPTVAGNGMLPTSPDLPPN